LYRISDRGLEEFQAAQASQAAEKVSTTVVPSEARNLSMLQTQEKERDSSAKNTPRNDKI
jgi:hypothetical protein